MSDPGPIQPQSAELVELSYTECVKRLASKRVGRLAVMVGYYPQVFPMNYLLDDSIVVVRAHAGTELMAANHANVSFQVDEIHEDRRSGWSVLVQGMAEDVTDRQGDPITERSRALGVDPWTGAEPRLLRIIPAKITGRELSPADLGHVDLVDLTKSVELKTASTETKAARRES